MRANKASKPMTDAGLAASEATRDFQAELVESITQLTDSQTSLAYSSIIQTRKNCESTNMSNSYSE